MHYPEISWMILARATLLLTTVTIACRFLRRQSAALRHALWASCLTALPLLLAADLLPALWQPTLFRSARPAVQPPVSSEPLPGDRLSWVTPDQQLLQSPIQRSADMTFTANEEPLPDPLTFSQSANHATTATTRSTVATAFSNLNLPKVLLLIWLSGVLAFSSQFAWRLYCTRQFLRQTTTVEIESINKRTHQLSKTLHLQRCPEIRMSPSNLVPVAAGLLRPCIVLPAQVSTWSASRIDVVLTHELAHICRYDMLTFTLSRIAVIFFWFHPLAWYGLKQLRTLQEFACDDLVLDSGLSELVYAEELRSLAAEMVFPRPMLAAAEVVRRGSLEQRIRTLLNIDLTRSHSPLSRRNSIFVSSVILLVIGGLSTVQPQVINADEPREVLIAVDDEIPLPVPPPLFDPSTAEPMFTEQREPGPFRQQIVVHDTSGSPVSNVRISPFGFGTSNGVGWQWFDGVWPKDYRTNAQGIATIEITEEQLKLVTREAGPLTFLSFTAEHPDFAPEHLQAHSVSDSRPVVLNRGLIVQPTVIDQTGQELHRDLYAISSGYPRTTWKVVDGKLRSAVFSRGAAPNIVRNVDGSPGRYFRIIHAPEGTHELLFSTVIDTAELKADSQLATPTITVEPGISLSGTLSDNVPRPVPADGFVVATVYNGFGNELTSWSDVVEIQPDGSFHFPSLPRNSNVEVWAFLNGWSSHASIESLKAYDEQHATRYSQVFVPPTAYSTPVRVSEQPVTTTLNMSPLGILECEVVDETGKSLPQAIVTMTPFRVTTAGTITLASDSRSIDYLRREAGYSVDERHRNFSWTRLTNLRGRATIENLPAGQQLVQCSLPGYSMVSNINYIAGISTFMADVVPGKTTRVRITMQKNSQSENALVYYQLPGQIENFSAFQLFVFDRDGRPAHDVTIQPIRQSLNSTNPAAWPSDWPPVERMEPGMFAVQCRIPVPDQTSSPGTPKGSIWLRIRSEQRETELTYEFNLAQPRPIQLP